MEVIKTYPTFLQGYVSFFYTVKENKSPYILDVGAGPAQRRLPDGTLDLVFNLGGAVLLSRDEVNYEKMPLAAVTGLYPDRSFIKYTKDIHLAGAVFQPGAAHLFIREILTQFRASTIDAGLIFGNSVYQLFERLKETLGEPEKHRLMEHFLMQGLQRNKEQGYFDRISSAIQQIHIFRGNLDVNFLSDHSYMSERNFRRKFNEYVGMNPKQYTDIVRLKEFIKVHETSGNNYNSHLISSGFNDQAHFNKNFRRIVGTNPGTYFRLLKEIDRGFIHLI